MTIAPVFSQRSSATPATRPEDAGARPGDTGTRARSASGPAADPR